MHGAKRLAVSQIALYDLTAPHFTQALWPHLPFPPKCRISRSSCVCVLPRHLSPADPDPLDQFTGVTGDGANGGRKVNTGSLLTGYPALRQSRTVATGSMSVKTQLSYIRGEGLVSSLILGVVYRRVTREFIIELRQRLTSPLGVGCVRSRLRSSNITKCCRILLGGDWQFVDESFTAEDLRATTRLDSCADLRRSDRPPRSRRAGVV